LLLLFEWIRDGDLLFRWVKAQGPTLAGVSGRWTKVKFHIVVSLMVCNARSTKGIAKKDRILDAFFGFQDIGASDESGLIRLPF